MNLAIDARAMRGDFSLEIPLSLDDSETVAVLGPNGSGKTTLVDVLAGLHPLSGGSVSLDGRVWEDPDRGIRLPPQDRSLGIMFQGLALFPALSVEDNVGFGLRAKGAGRDECRREAAEWLARFGIADLAKRSVAEISGGQAQLVALARSLAVRPEVLILDEPMSSIDVDGRARVRRALRSALEDFPGIKILITHSPMEAMALAGIVVILENGRVAQQGPVGQIGARPRSSYVASLVDMTLLRGVIGEDRGRRTLETSNGTLVVATDLAPGDEALATVDPKAIALHRDKPLGGSARNLLDARVIELDPVGDRVRVLLASSPELVAEVTGDAISELQLKPGDRVWALLKATQVEVYPA